MVMMVMTLRIELFDSPLLPQIPSLMERWNLRPSLHPMRRIPVSNPIPTTTAASATASTTGRASRRNGNGREGAPSQSGGGLSRGPARTCTLKLNQLRLPDSLTKLHLGSWHGRVDALPTLPQNLRTFNMGERFNAPIDSIQ